MLSWSLPISPLTPDISRVSILVVVECSPEAFVFLIFLPLICRFQSLLSWNALLKQGVERSKIDVFACFNPCCGGMLSWRQSNVVFLCVAMSEFQSLLWWNALLKLINLSPIRFYQRSFNPCCGGMLSWSNKRRLKHYLETCFNPCCGGMLSWSLTKEPGETIRFTFQSLLWWNALLK